MCGYFCIGFIDFTLAGKKLTDFTSLICLYDFKKNDNRVQKVISKMNKINEIKLSEQTKFRLSEIIGIENYFYQENNQKKSGTK